MDLLHCATWATCCQGLPLANGTRMCLTPEHPSIVQNKFNQFALLEARLFWAIIGVAQASIFADKEKLYTSARNWQENARVQIKALMKKRVRSTSHERVLAGSRRRIRMGLGFGAKEIQAILQRQAADDGNQCGRNSKQ